MSTIPNLQSASPHEGPGLGGPTRRTLEEWMTTLIEDPEAAELFVAAFSSDPDERSLELENDRKRLVERLEQLVGQRSSNRLESGRGDGIGAPKTEANAHKPDRAERARRVDAALKALWSLPKQADWPGDDAFYDRNGFPL